MLSKPLDNEHMTMTRATPQLIIIIAPEETSPLHIGGGRKSKYCPVLQHSTSV